MEGSLMLWRRLLIEFLKDQPRDKIYLMVFISDLGSANRSFSKKIYWWETWQKF